MRPVVLDFETFFSDEFTLSKMSTEAYIRDPRFIAHGAAIRWSPNHPARWYDEKELRQVLAEEDWSDIFLICWHAAFDGLILTHHYGVNPKMWACPMSMARMLLPAHQSVSLDNVRKLYGMPPKTTPYNLFRGKHWHELTSDEQDKVARGAEDEVESIFTLFQRFAQEFPTEEYEVVDEIIRMFVNPVLRADVNLLAKIWEEENAAKSRRMANLAVVAGDLQSSDRFISLLEAEGVEVEYKNGKNGPIPALAKTDDFLRDLLDHSSERVRTLAEARIGAKSTLLQTRAETLGFAASRGALPVYLRYCGASTLRPTGGDGSNFLNMKRQSPIRKTLMAPEGYLLGPVDASQIELRVGHYLAGGPDEPVLQMLREGKDPYADLAGKFYGETIYRPAKGDPREHEMESKRGAGKQGRLMCLYGASGKQFQVAAKNGLYGPPIDMSLEEANRFVQTYRADTPAVCAPHTGYWAQANRMLARLGGGPPVEWGPLTVRDHRIYLPSGVFMNYESLEHHVPSADEEVRDFERDGYWRVRTKRGWKKMWGSKLVQNICEGVSRVIVSQALIRIRHLGYRALNWPYDELLLLILKDGHEQEHLDRCLIEMRKTPEWLPGLPLDAEGHLGERYSK